jgi:hypothetical protein
MSYPIDHGDEPLAVELLDLQGDSTSDERQALFDPATQTYFFPTTPEMRVDPSLLLTDPQGDAIATAFLDSGVMTAHPVISHRLRSSIDFTGEGIEDLNGHGTMVALLSYTQNTSHAIVNVKVLNKSGFGRQDWLVKGLRWVRENAARYNIRTVNLSAGIYGNKWGFLPCNSDCPVCNEARALYDSGVMVVVAAGNDGPDQLPCPQRVGILEDKFLVVAAVDPFTHNRAEYSGKGNIHAPEARVLMKPPDSLKPVNLED